jgi:DNA mismatch repair protein MutH
MKELPYNKYDPYSIETYARRLLNSSLRKVLADTKALEAIIKGKGSLGQLIEEHYFFYKPNNIAGPDFPEAGVELKTTPVLQGKILKAKERLVFNIINYEEEYNKEFVESSFWRKNNLLLLMFYLHEKEDIDIDLIFKIIRLFRFPAVDLKIIKDDWEFLKAKIRAGKAHEISEGDTFYLGACTKGANSNSTRSQPFSDIPAKQRAYSLKPKYLNVIIEKTLKGDELVDQTEDYRKIFNSNLIADPLAKYSTKDSYGRLSPIIKSVDDFKENETFEDIVLKLFRPYYGHTERRLFEELGLKATNAKSRYYNLAKAILKVNGDKIEEFEKAEIELKTIRFEHNGSLKESMSFPQIKYKEIINEDWEESELFERLSRKFFLVVFKKNKSGEPVLEKVKFWNMPWNDLEKMHDIWYDTKVKIDSGDFRNFIKLSKRLIGHIRPKARNAKDLMETGLGTLEKKKAFWLSASYIKNVVTDQT